MGLSVALAAAGILYAYRRYWTGPTRDSALAGSRAYRTLLNKYYVDEIYDATAVEGTVRGGEGLFRFDQKVVDGAVNGSASLTRLSGDLSDLSDQNLVDRAVNLVAEILAAASHAVPAAPDRALPELRPSHAVRRGPAGRGPHPVELSAHPRR